MPNRAVRWTGGIGLVKGLCATSPTLDAKEFVTGAQFLENFRTAGKIDPAYGGIYTYDAMHVLSGTIRRAESVKSVKITGTLCKLDGYAPVNGLMKWDAVGEHR